MGLFDSAAYDPSTYQDDGGLIGRLLQQFGVQGQYQPSAGFQQSPMDANAAMPAQQNAPIAVGNYQMPRIGAGFPGFPQHDPDTGETVAPQQPVQAATLPAQQQPTSPLPTALQPPQPTSGLGGAFRGALANMQAGPIGMIAGAIGGGMGMGRGTPEDQQKKALYDQYQALIPVLGEQKARLAVINPEAGKIMLQEALSNKQKFVQLKDAMGAEHPAFVDETNQTVNGKPVSALPTGDANTGLGDITKTGKEYLDTVPMAQRGTVQGMVEGTIPPPSSFALTKPYWQNMIAAAKNVDPTFDAANWSARVAGMKSFKSGADAGTVRSANQVLGHISDLTDKADELHNGAYPMWNRVKNTWDSQTGADAANNWVTQAHAVADEMSSFMKGAGHSSDTEIKQWAESLSPNMSPQQQRGAIKTLMGIYDHALQALEDKRTGAIGPTAAEKLGPLVTSAGQTAMDKVNNWAVSTGASGASDEAKTTGTVAPLKVGESTTIGKVTIKKVGP